MKQFFIDYSLNVIVAVGLLSVGGFIAREAQMIYYQYAPLDTFYINNSFFASDVCTQSPTQLIISDRRVLGTDTGYPALVNKELYRFNGDVKTKVYEESATPFVEVTTEPIQREQHLPTNLAVGLYQWVLYVNLDINGVQREVVPPVASNIFEILICE